MAELVRDIVLTAYPLSMLGKIKAALGFDRIAAIDFMKHQDKINGMNRVSASRLSTIADLLKLPVETFRLE